MPRPRVFSRNALGLALFLYGVDVQYGKQFFIGLTSPAGLKANGMALIGVLLADAVSIFFVKAMDVNLGHAMGLFWYDEVMRKRPPAAGGGAPAPAAPLREGWKA